VKIDRVDFSGSDHDRKFRHLEFSPGASNNGGANVIEVGKNRRRHAWLKMSGLALDSGGFMINILNKFLTACNALNL
jgi:hypothetical protein